MATQRTRKQTAASAKLGEKDFVARLADAGEEALQRLAELPGGQRAVGAFNELRSGMDELSKKVRGIDALEARVAKLEKEIAELKRPRRAPAKRASARRRPTTGTGTS
jgi:uncharacterized protein YceH (UPF0502 family)